MVVVSFYLLGKDPKQSQNVHMVEIDITHDLDAAKTYVADSFSVVDPSGVGFQTADAKPITDIDTLLDAEQPIAVTIDGHAVRDAPGPTGLPVVGTHFQIHPDNVGNNQRLFDKHGATIKYTDMGRTLYLTSDPAIAAQIFQESAFWSKEINGNHPLLPTKDNEAGLFICDTDTRAWKLTHKFLPPALSPKAVRKYTPMMQKTAEESFRVFDHFAEEGEAFDTFAYMFKLTSQAVAKLILNHDMHHFDSADAPLDTLVSDILTFFNLVKKVAERGSWYAHLPFGDPKRLRDVQAKFFDTCKEGLRKAQAKGGEDLPIATAALEAESIADFAARAIDEEGNKLPIDVTLATLPVLIAAGFVTTATLMSWMVYCATAYPGVQDQLLQELVDHGVTADTQWNFDTTNELRYLDKFIKETQRLYNPVVQPARTAQRDQILPGGFEVRKGSIMVCALHSLHRNKDVWDDAGKFDPDRWDTEKVRNRGVGAYIPFATGPRSCVGFNLALQEAKTMFATLLYRYEFVKYGDNVISYDIDASIYKPFDFYVQVRRRTSWPKPSA